MLSNSNDIIQVSWNQKGHSIYLKALWEIKSEISKGWALAPISKHYFFPAFSHVVFFLGDFLQFMQAFD